MKLALLVSFLALNAISALNPVHNRMSSSRSKISLRDSNSDVFGASTVAKVPTAPVSAGTVTTPAAATAPAPSGSITARQQRSIDEANKLRAEAEEAEFALRDEAREKGIPEEMINKLMPIRDTPRMSKDQRKIAILKGV